MILENRYKIVFYTRQFIILRQKCEMWLKYYILGYLQLQMIWSKKKTALKLSRKEKEKEELINHVSGRERVTHMRTDGLLQEHTPQKIHENREVSTRKIWTPKLTKERQRENSLQTSEVDVPKSHNTIKRISRMPMKHFMPIHFSVQVKPCLRNI